MFITSNDLAPFRHPSITLRKQNHWAAVTRALESPWYLLVYDVTSSKGQRVSQTSLVACDDALVDLLDTMNEAAIRGIGRLDRLHGSGPSWGLKWIDAVWKPGLGEVRMVGALLLRFDAEPIVRDALLRPVEELPGRQLLYSVGGVGRSMGKIGLETGQHSSVV